MSWEYFLLLYLKDVSEDKLRNSKRSGDKINFSNILIYKLVMKVRKHFSRIANSVNERDIFADDGSVAPSTR